MNRLFSEERDAYVLGLLRLALSTLLLLNCTRLVLELGRGGYFGDFFHIPMLPEAWLPSRAGYAFLLGAQGVAAILAFLGLRSREALLVASSTGLFLLGCDRLQYHNNRYALLLLGFVLAFTPCDRSLLIARRSPRTLPLAARIAPTYARRLFQIQVSLVYLGSASGKLLDADWRAGQVLLLRFMSVAPFWAARGVTLPTWLNAGLSSPLFGSFAAKVAIATELFIALGLCLPRTRRLALWVGVLFHFWIEVAARVELFSWVMGAAYLAFVVPEVRERRFEFDPQSPRGRALGRALRWLDWCARFQISEMGTTDRDTSSFRVTGRDGRTTVGLAGLAAVAEATPLLFPLWPLLWLIAKLQRA